MYCAVFCIHEWAISRKLLVNDIFKKNFDVDFIKCYDKKSDLGYFREIDVPYPKKLCRLYNDLLFLQDMGTKKCKSIVCSSHHKRKYFANIRTLKKRTKAWINITKSTL